MSNRVVPADAAPAAAKPAVLHGPGGPPPFWIDQMGEIQGTMAKKKLHRKGDIVIAVPAKSGTTWSMNIVHQLRAGGDPEVRDIYEQVHWMELWDHPNQTLEEKLDFFAKQPTWYRRAFKTHSGFGQNGLEYNPDVSYIIVMRDPRDAGASFLPFIKKHTAAYIDFFNSADTFGGLQTIPDADTLWNHPMNQNGGRWTNFMKAFWPYRNKDNVLVMHFADMKKDHVGTIKKVAQFLGYDLPQSKFDKVCEYTSFKWMKANGAKFALRHLCPVPILEVDGMMRNGGVGEGKSALSAKSIDAFNKKMVADGLSPAQIKWLLEGGELP